MTDIGTRDARGTALLPGAHRVVRVLDADEGPFEGALVTSGDAVAVRMDVSALGGWIGWRYSGAEHVAAPIDVIRRRGGHDVLLPWCPDQVLGFLIRRSATGAALRPGECSTLVVSLLRGLDEIGEGGEPGEGVESTRTGVWWVTDGGRPVFVFGPGQDARAGAEEIVRRLGEGASDKVLKRALNTVANGLEKASVQPRIPRRLLDIWEQELLNVAAPQPLDRGAHPPEQAQDVAQVVTTRESILPRNGQRLRSDRRRKSRGIVAAVVTVAGAGKELFGIAAARIAAVIRGRRERRTRAAEDAGTRSHPRRRPFIVAAAVAAAVLAAGLLWPEGGDPGEADAGRRRAGETASVMSGDAPSATPVPEAADGQEAAEGADTRKAADESRAAEDAERSSTSLGDDPVAAAEALFTTITECRVRADSACPDAAAPGSDGVVNELVAAAQGTAVELVDEYGDVAVVRLDVDDADSEMIEPGTSQPRHQVVVLIRAEEKWLVRDVYDVADQP
ncbi:MULTISPECIES: hypothetical protein [unclassified Microbacterium]|uniref:hypothetical protein n=1 Tax=unclassified Microbacterium TaxID=2609290 RepID=UPI001F0D935A|nr:MULTISPECIES: hypothetical protein [unclassified Microbacterium]